LTRRSLLGLESEINRGLLFAPPHSFLLKEKERKKERRKKIKGL
jgi:hypothetical protein